MVLQKKKKKIQPLDEKSIKGEHITDENDSKSNNTLSEISQ